MQWLRKPWTLQFLSLASILFDTSVKTMGIFFESARFCALNAVRPLLALTNFTRRSTHAKPRQSVEQLRRPKMVASRSLWVDRSDRSVGCNSYPVIDWRCFHAVSLGLHAVAMAVTTACARCSKARKHSSCRSSGGWSHAAFRQTTGAH